MLTQQIRRSLFISGALALLLSGCRTLDPSSEIAQAAAVVAERSGALSEWSKPPPARPLGRTLTIGEAIERALMVHPTLRRDIARVAAARADLVAHDRLPNPVLSFGIGTPFDGGGGSPLSGGLLAPLTALVTRPARVAAAEASLRAEVLALADQALRTIETVSVQCAQVHHGRLRVALDTREVELLTEHVQIIRMIVDAGEAGRATWDAARVELAHAADRLIQSRTALALHERALLEALGAIETLEECPEIDPTSLPSLAADSVQIPDEHALIGMVALRRLDVAAAVARAESAGRKLRVVSRGRFGAVGGTLGLERNFDGREAIKTGLTFEVPIFDFGGARVAKADAERTALVYEAEIALWNGYLEARSSRAQVVGTRERLAGLTAHWLPAAHAHARLIAETAAAGEASRPEAIHAEALAIAADRVFNETALEGAQALFSLARTAGGTFAPLTQGEVDRIDVLPDPPPLAHSGDEGRGR